jgi:hypothetical protein
MPFTAEFLRSAGLALFAVPATTRARDAASPGPVIDGPALPLFLRSARRAFRPAASRSR